MDFQYIDECDDRFVLAWQEGGWPANKCSEPYSRTFAREGGRYFKAFGTGNTLLQCAAVTRVLLRLQWQGRREFRL